MNQHLESQNDSLAPGQLRAGVAKSEITTNEPGIVIHDPLYAKALVLSDGDTTGIIIAMDVTAIGGICDVSDDFLPNLRSRIESELGIPGANVLVNASHTHPPGRILCDDAQQIERTFDAVKRAYENLTPVKAGTGAGHEDSIMMNRNLTLKNGKHWTIRHANPTPPDDEVVSVGPIDPEIGILRLDRLDGTPFAVVFNYAGHSLWGAPRGAVTADWPGIACGVIEDNLGHDAMAFFLQGAGGDIIDVMFKDFGRPRNIEPVGLKLGLSTLRGYRGIETGDAKLSIVSETIELPHRTDIAERIEALRKEQAEILTSLRFNSLNFKSFLPLYLQHTLNPKYPNNNAYAYLQDEKLGFIERAATDEITAAKVEEYLLALKKMETLIRIEDDIATLERHQGIIDDFGKQTISTEIMGFKVGDCVFITAPIEILTEVSLNVKSASPYQNTFMAAFTNGYMHYGPPAWHYELGGYEVTECFFAPEWQQMFESTAANVISKL